MRKLIITAALATLALAVAAGCADNSVKPSSSESASAAAPAVTSAADQTTAVCTEAASYSATAGQAVSQKAQDIAAANGDQVKQLQIGGDLIKLANDWSAKLTELSAKPVKPEVKSALTEGAATISGLTSPAAIQSANATQIQAQLTTLVQKISTACTK